jgi:lysophospholipid acyltransferase (LPLAT)-like uncharacterized protein
MQALIAWLAAALIRLLCLTWRVRLTGLPPDFQGPPLVFCFWHGRQAALFAHPRPRPVTVLASRSRDGGLQARILTRLGFRVRRGSSSRGGAAGLVGILEEMRQGADAVFAVDGPRGPLHRVKPGAVLAAKAMNTAIVPLIATASSAWVFEKAWDRYTLPKPFARVEIRRGTPIAVDEAVEVVAKRIEDALGGGADR